MSHSRSQQKQKTKENIDVGFHVLMTVIMMSCVIWGTTPCSPVKFPSASIKSQVFHAGFLLGLFFHYAGYGDMFHRNVS
jgi:hypothetical protein